MKKLVSLVAVLVVVALVVMLVVKNDGSQLVQAVLDDDFAQVRALIASGVDVNAKDDGGYTPLHMASGARPEITIALLEAGADVHMKDSDDMTPLHTLASYGKPIIVKALLEAGADVNVKDSRYGLTPLHVAAWHSEHSATITALIKAGSKVNMKDNSGNTPLNYADANQTASREAIIKLLKARGAR